MDWAREVEDTEAETTKRVNSILDRPKEIREEKRGVSEVAVKKGLPLGLTRNIGKFIGRTQGGKKSRRAKRRVSKKKTSKRKASRK